MIVASYLAALATQVHIISEIGVRIQGLERNEVFITYALLLQKILGIKKDSHCWLSTPKERVSSTTSKWLPISVEESVRSFKENNGVDNLHYTANGEKIQVYIPRAEKLTGMAS